MKIIILVKFSGEEKREEYNPAIWARYLSKKYDLNAEIICISMDNLTVIPKLKKFFDYNVQKVYLLNDLYFAGADTLATSATIARAIQLLEPDYNLILTNAISSNGETGHVPIQVSANLNIPFGCNVIDVCYEEGRWSCIQDYGYYLEKIVINASEKLLLSINLSLNNDVKFLGQPTLFDLYKNQKNIEIIDNNFLQISKNRCGYKGARTIVKEAVELTNCHKNKKVVIKATNELKTYLNKLVLEHYEV